MDQDARFILYRNETAIQVEHPLTEFVTGAILIKAQYSNRGRRN